MWIQAGAPSITVAFSQLIVHIPLTTASTSCARSSVFSRHHEKNEKGCCCLRRATCVLLSSTCTPLPAATGVLAIPRHERKVARRRRSFRRRQAPITRGQRKTLRDLSPKYGLAMDYKDRWNFDKIFSRPLGDAAATEAAAGDEADAAAADDDVADAAAATGRDGPPAAAAAGGDGDAMAVRGGGGTSAAVTLDIGFGSGESLLGMAAARPDDCFLGVEVHKPGVAAALAKIEAEALTNVRIVQGDVITALCDHVEDRSLDECCIFFPDPFPGDRDADRRLVRPLLLSLLSSKLRPGGALHLATDVEEYAEHIGRIMSATRPEKQQSESFFSPPGTYVQAVALSQLESEPEPELESGWGWKWAAKSKGLLARGDESPARRSREVGGVQAADIGVEGACWEGGETSERPLWRPLTSYERKAREAGRCVRDFSYRLEVPSPPLSPLPRPPPL